MKKEELFCDLVEEIMRQRVERLNEKEYLGPVGRVDFYGHYNLREDFFSYLSGRKAELGVSSIEQMSDRGVVIFNDGARTYDIFLDQLFSLCK